MTDESDYPEPQTSMLGERDERLPVRVLHYATIVDRPNPTLALGPNVMNEPLFPVTYCTDDQRRQPVPQPHTDRQRRT
jgi:hypothetical protein